MLGRPYKLLTQLTFFMVHAKRDGMDDVKNKDQNLTVFTTEQDLANMKKNREKFVQQMGQDKYDSLVKKLENHISNRKQPRSASSGAEV